jgi:hypothetical protein
LLDGTFKDEVEGISATLERQRQRVEDARNAETF